MQPVPHQPHPDGRASAAPPARPQTQDQQQQPRQFRLPPIATLLFPPIDTGDWNDQYRGANGNSGGTLLVGMPTATAAAASSFASSSSSSSSAAAAAAPPATTGHPPSLLSSPSLFFPSSGPFSSGSVDLAVPPSSLSRLLATGPPPSSAAQPSYYLGIDPQQQQQQQLFLLPSSSNLTANAPSALSSPLEALTAAASLVANSNQQLYMQQYLLFQQQQQQQPQPLTKKRRRVATPSIPFATQQPQPPLQPRDDGGMFAGRDSELVLWESVQTWYNESAQLAKKFAMTQPFPEDRPDRKASRYDWTCSNPACNRKPASTAAATALAKKAPNAFWRDACRHCGADSLVECRWPNCRYTQVRSSVALHFLHHAFDFIYVEHANVHSFICPFCHATETKRINMLQHFTQHATLPLFVCASCPPHLFTNQRQHQKLRIPDCNAASPFTLPGQGLEKKRIIYIYLFYI